MTIKELYEEAKKLGREDWDIVVCDFYGPAGPAESLNWTKNEEGGEVMILP